MGRRLQSFYKTIASSPLPPYAAFSLIRIISSACALLKSPQSVLEGDGRIIKPLIPSNDGYGHEYWLKRYCGYSGNVYGAIEHGVYFGDNTSTTMNPIPNEWRFGSFITYGKYRADLLKAAYPKHLITRFGPYIQYVQSDCEYKEALRKALPKEEGKTLTVFPAHSVKHGKRKFDHANLAEVTAGFAASNGYQNTIACISPMDFVEETLSEYQARGFIIATSGIDPYSFLPRQRAVMELSDITVSNDLGTHVGYSVSLGVPHTIIDPVEDDDMDGLDSGTHKDVLIRQKRIFNDAFSAERSVGEITKEQRQLVKYFWGDSFLSPEEMSAAFQSMNAHRELFQNK